MEGRRAPQGLDVEDTVAFGLTAPHLAYVVLGVLAAYTAWGSALPAWLRYPVGALLVGVGAALGWGRARHRPVDHWLWLAARYWLRPRRSPLRVLDGGVAPSAPSPPPGPAPAVALEAVRRVAFYATRGGVGKTTLVAELALGLAGEGVAVAVIDADLLGPSLGAHFGVAEPGLSDAVRAGPDTPVAACVKTHEGSGVRILAGGLQPLTASHHRRLAGQRVLDAVRHFEATGAQVILIDTGRELDAATEAALCAADTTCVVLTPTPAAVHATYQAVALLARLGLRDRLALVLNRAADGVDVSELVGDLGLPLLAAVPADRRLEAGAMGPGSPPGVTPVAVAELARALRAMPLGASEAQAASAARSASTSALTPGVFSAAALRK